MKRDDQNKIVKECLVDIMAKHGLQPIDLIDIDMLSVRLIYDEVYAEIFKRFREKGINL
jgi:hypothetical protein